MNYFCGMGILENFISLVEQSIEKSSFVKITLSKPKDKDGELKNVYIRQLNLKGTEHLSFNFTYKTNDQTKNYDIAVGLYELENLFTKEFKNASLITHDWNYQLMTSKKGKVSLLKLKNTQEVSNSTEHDRVKSKYVTGDELYLKLLGVADDNGNIIPKMADKYRQINKYLEIVAGLIATTDLPAEIHAVDMGSGKGYLTFALYDYLKNKLGKDVKMTGVELREELVILCNVIAQKCKFGELKFEAKKIEEYKKEKIDVLIALHACDTATDDALSSGIAANAALIISAPCCHKQIRQQLKGKEQKSPLLKYGIFKERQFEMVTDTLRALILEKHQYQSKIFEFVSNEHTRKNILLVGTKSSKQANIESIDSKIESIKSEYGIESHYLEELV